MGHCTACRPLSEPPALVGSALSPAVAGLFAAPAKSCILLHFDASGPGPPGGEKIGKSMLFNDINHFQPCLPSLAARATPLLHRASPLHAGPAAGDALGRGVSRTHPACGAGAHLSRRGRQAARLVTPVSGRCPVKTAAGKTGAERHHRLAPRAPISQIVSTLPFLTQT
jgi:hypothetical protein